MPLKREYKNNEDQKLKKNALLKRIIEHSVGSKVKELELSKGL